MFFSAQEPYSLILAKAWSPSYIILMKVYHGDQTFIETRASYENRFIHFEGKFCFGQLWADLIKRGKISA